MGFAFSQAFILTGMFAYISGSPFVLQNIFGVSAQMFSFLFAVNGAGIIAATQITGRLAAKRDERTLFTFGLILSIIGSIALLAALALNLGIIAVCIALFVIVSCVGIVTTTGFALAMQKQEKGAGSAAALLGLLPFIGGALAAPLVGIAGEENAWPMALSIFGFDLLAVLSYVFLVKETRRHDKTLNFYWRALII